MNPQLDSLIRLTSWIEIVFGTLTVVAAPFCALIWRGSTKERSTRTVRIAGIGAVILFIGLFVLLLNRPGASIPVDPKANSIVTHRINATVMGLFGWYHADSTEGNFAVEFPLPFSDLTLRSKKPDGHGVTTAYTLIAKSNDGIKMTAIKLPAECVEKSGLELLNFERKKGLVVENKTRTFDYFGAKATEWLEQGSESASYFRTLDFSSGSIILSVEYPLLKGNLVEPMRVRFFNSLVMKIPDRSSDPTLASGMSLSGQDPRSH
ncbi:MAG: hypothetical protein WCA95_09860 [Opitutaceae bacterium]